MATFDNAKGIGQRLTRIDDYLLKALGYPWLVNRQCVSIGQRTRWILSHVRGTRCAILDAGFGGGAATFALAARGHHVTAIDLAPAVEKLARRYALLESRTAGAISPICWDLRRLDQLGFMDQFDYVVISEVIEHVSDDRKLVEDLSRLLKPGGILLLTTPNKAYHGLVGDRVSATEDGGHVRWGYTAQDLVDLFRPASLRIQEVAYLGGYATQQHINLRRRIRNLLHPVVGSLDEGLGMIVTYPLRPLARLDAVIPFEAMTIAVAATRESAVTQP